MKAIVTRKFIIKDKELKEYMQENDISEDELEDSLLTENSYELEELSHNDFIFDTEVEVEE